MRQSRAARDRRSTRHTAPAVWARSVVLARGRSVVLDASDLDIAPGSFCALIGPNGSGKTTLLDALAGLLPPAAGALEVLGRDPVTARPDVAYVLQSSTVNEALPLSARDVVSMGRWSGGSLRRLGIDDRRRIAEALELLGVDDVARRRLGELSGGERQRVLVAQGLVQDAPLTLLDEPLTGVDVASHSVVLDALRARCARGATVVMSTHDLTEAAGADHVVLLNQRVVAEGTSRAVITEPNLAAVYGDRLVRLPDARGLVDDPHHEHG
jgi:iron complex transport system ATP-binding protein